MYMCVYIYIYTHMCVYIYIYIYTHIHNPYNMPWNLGTQDFFYFSHRLDRPRNHPGSRLMVFWGAALTELPWGFTALHNFGKP